MKNLTILMVITLILSLSCKSKNIEKDYYSYYEKGKGFFLEAENMAWVDFFSDTDGSYFYDDYDNKLILFEEAKLALYDSAATYLKKANVILPDNQESHYYLGYVYDRLFNGISGFSLDLLRDKGDKYLAETKKISQEFEKTISDDKRYEGEIYILGPRSKITAAWSMLAFSYYLNNKTDSIKYAFSEGKKRGGFPDVLLEFCRNLLISCDTDAILFVAGDNDTFPMWYLQEMEGFRKDVTVVNLSLANLNEYIRIYKHSPPFGGQKIPFSFPDEILKDDKSTDSVLTSQFLDSSEFEIEIMVDKQVLDEFTNDKKILKNQNVSLTCQGFTRDEISLLRVADLAVIDIIKQVKFETPVYYSSTSIYPDNTVMAEYLRNEGLAYRICPIPASQTKTGVYNREVIDSCLINSITDRALTKKDKYTFSFYETSNNEIYHLESYYYIHNIIKLFKDYIDYLLNEEEDLDGALKIINVLINTFPDEKFHLGSHLNYYMALISDKKSETEKTNEYAEKSIVMAIESSKRIFDKNSPLDTDIRIPVNNYKTIVNAYFLISNDDLKKKYYEEIINQKEIIRKYIEDFDGWTDYKEYLYMELDSISEMLKKDIGK